MQRMPRSRPSRNDDHEPGEFSAVLVTIFLVGLLLSAASFAGL
jgi:hypothetical protein